MCTWNNLDGDVTNIYAMRAVYARSESVLRGGDDLYALKNIYTR